MRATFLPFSLPTIEQEEIDEVVDSLKSGWLTTGPKVIRFEDEIRKLTGAPYVIATNSCTSALLLCLRALGIGPRDEVITTPLTFAATVNMIVIAGARPVLADIDRATLQIDPSQIEKAITPRTKAIIPVHFAGQPSDLDAIHEIGRRRGIEIIEDAAHAIGTEYKGQKIGSISKVCVFSFHPIKNITTGEGGAVCTTDPELADRIRILRFHGLSKEAWSRYSEKGVAEYEILEPGFKFNMLDLQAAIGIHQLKKLDRFTAAKERMVRRYEESLSGIPGLILPQRVRYPHRHTWHLYTPLMDLGRLKIDRTQFIAELKKRKIGAGIHYQAIHHHSYYRETLKIPAGALPNADFVSPRIVSLPLYPKMSDQDQSDVIEAVKEVLGLYAA
ncbi:MAG: DegT/DnrJ/EryC1/StrS aminotransferase family protein [Desulfobacteraceae bacterium]|nr:MAG: DegT/DnrJ/EryC1/StrS aminotransferase family protein [Desulfobacteraceae bacterium]